MLHAGPLHTVLALTDRGWVIGLSALLQPNQPIAGGTVACADKADLL